MSESEPLLSSSRQATLMIPGCSVVVTQKDGTVETIARGVLTVFTEQNSETVLEVSPWRYVITDAPILQSNAVSFVLAAGPQDNDTHFTVLFRKGLDVSVLRRFEGILTQTAQLRHLEAFAASVFDDNPTAPSSAAAPSARTNATLSSTNATSSSSSVSSSSSSSTSSSSSYTSSSSISGAGASEKSFPSTSASQQPTSDPAPSVEEDKIIHLQRKGGGATEDLTTTVAAASAGAVSGAAAEAGSGTNVTQTANIATQYIIQGGHLLAQGVVAGAELTTRGLHWGVQYLKGVIPVSIASPSAAAHPSNQPQTALSITDTASSASSPTALTSTAGGEAGAAAAAAAAPPLTAEEIAAAQKQQHETLVSVRSKLSQAKIVTGGLALTSRIVVQGASAAVTAVASSIVDAASKTEMGQKVAGGAATENGKAAAQVAFASLDAVGEVWDAMVRAAAVVGSAAGQASIDLVEHRWGEEAGDTAKEAVAVTSDLLVTTSAVGNLRLTNLARATALEVGKQGVIAAKGGGGPVGGQQQLLTRPLPGEVNTMGLESVLALGAANESSSSHHASTAPGTTIAMLGLEGNANRSGGGGNSSASAASNATAVVVSGSAAAPGTSVPVATPAVVTSITTSLSSAASAAYSLATGAHAMAFYSSAGKVASQAANTAASTVTAIANSPTTAAVITGAGNAATSIMHAATGPTAQAAYSHAASTASTLATGTVKGVSDLYGYATASSAKASPAATAQVSVSATLAPAPTVQATASAVQASASAAQATASAVQASASAAQATATPNTATGTSRVESKKQ